MDIEETKCYCGHTTTCECGPEEVVKDLKEKLAGYKTQAPKEIKPTQKPKAKSNT
mgnify:CR=1 FL=1